MQFHSKGLIEDTWITLKPKCAGATSGSASDLLVDSM
jgi:hypothetical protein